MPHNFCAGRGLLKLGIVIAITIIIIIAIIDVSCPSTHDIGQSSFVNVFVLKHLIPVLGMYLLLDKELELLKQSNHQFS